MRYHGVKFSRREQRDYIRRIYEVLLDKDKDLAALINECVYYIDPDNEYEKTTEEVTKMLFQMYRRLSSLPVKPIMVVFVEEERICFKGMKRSLLPFP